MTCETCAKVVSEQRDEASLHGLSKTEIDCGMSAFEHKGPASGKRGVMMSAFVWLDYSRRRERRKMLDVVDLFREHDTRDELGIGSVRDAFADMLFPGTSTIMTRARYFLLVAWTYQRLEKLRVRSGGDSGALAEGRTGPH